MNKLFWITLPLLVLGLVVLARAVIRRPIPRHDLNVIVSLFLFVYLFTTASLGLFWVARMDLPVFDLHYLFGYCLLVLAAVHVWFQLPIVNAWLRKKSPRALLEPDGKRWKRSVRIIALTTVVVLFLAVAGIILYEFLRPAPTIILEEEKSPIGLFRSDNESVFAMLISNSMNDETAFAEDAPKRIWLSHRGKRMTAAGYIHEATGITRWGVFRSPRFVGAQPEEVKSFPGKPSVSLPAPRKRAVKSFTEVVHMQLSAPPAAPKTTLTKQELADLLHYAYGVTETRRFPGGSIGLRAAASAGALYPTDVYVAVRNVEELQKGIYYYHPRNHQLVQTGSAEDMERLALASAYHGWLVNSPATFILTVMYDRTAWKYRDRSYRYVMLDAAHVAGNLTLAATALGLEYQTIGLFDDQLATQALGLKSDDEGMVMMIALGRYRVTPQMKLPAFDLPILPKNVDDVEMTRLAHLLTSVRWKAGSVPISPLSSEKPAERNATAGTQYPLPKSSAGTRDLFEVIQTRRSFRDFARREVQFEDLAGIIRESFPWHQQPAIIEGGRWSHLYLVVRAVAGLPSGVYRYNSDGDRLEQIAAGKFSDAISDAGLSQELLSLAAVVFVWTIDMTRVGELHGERDYRYACVEIGMSGERAYLAAGARGLGACGVGAFYDDEVERVLRLQDTQRRAMYLMGIGQRR
jgi:SagB-type dehydrogenase family enzyme